MKENKATKFFNENNNNKNVLNRLEKRQNSGLYLDFFKTVCAKKGY